MGIVFVLKVGPGFMAETGLEDRGTLVVDVKVEVVDVRELTVFIRVTEDVTVGVGVISVVTVSVETSLVGVSVVFRVDVA